MTLKVFVADDSVTIQKIVSLAFSEEDVEIEAVSDGDAALDSLQRFKPDIVLADVFMPGCTGYEVCERIKHDPALQHIPVVLLVGTFEPFDESEASRVNCDGHLTKPFDTSELIQTVHRLVGRKTSCEMRNQSESSVPSVIGSIARGFVSKAALESFLGDNAILDILDPAIVPAGARIAPEPAPSTVLSEDTLNLIVNRVILKMSPEVIRDVAWEVVPELSETIIRKAIKEQQ